MESPREESLLYVFTSEDNHFQPVGPLPCKVWCMCCLFDLEPSNNRSDACVLSQMHTLHLSCVPYHDKYALLDIPWHYNTVWHYNAILQYDNITQYDSMTDTLQYSIGVLVLDTTLCYVRPSLLYYIITYIYIYIYILMNRTGSSPSWLYPALTHTYIHTHLSMARYSRCICMWICMLRRGVACILKYMYGPGVNVFTRVYIYIYIYIFVFTNPG